MMTDDVSSGVDWFLICFFLGLKITLSLYKAI